MRTTNNKKKLIGAVAVAGIVAAGGSAFTATGVTDNAAPEQFVGGTVSQVVKGATLNDIGYTFADGSNTAIRGVTLTFATDALGKHVAIALSGNGDTPTTFTCSDVAAVTFTSDCTVTDYAGATGIDVTVS